MNDSDFDPYHKWLSIPRSEQPANYYRLLGVSFFESDPDVIESAAQRQITYVRSFALGQHAELSQSILNELAKARATLLDAAAKAKYDASLNAQRQQPAVVPSPPAATDDVMQSVPFDIPTVPVAPRKTSRPKNRRKQRSKLIPLIAGFAVALLVIATIGWLLSDPKQPVVAELPVSKQPSRDIQVVEDQDGVQPSQPQSRLGSILDSAKPSVGGTAEAMNEEAGDATELGVESEITIPPEPEEERTETAVVSSEQSDANNTPPAAVAPFDSDQAKTYQEAWAEHLGLEVEVTNSIGMKLRVIPPGTFTMGEENDAHEVTLTKPFMLGVYEVTQEQYEQVMGVNPSRVKGAMNPVERVSWTDAVEFCRKLSELPAEKTAGNVYRLPTEAEWEFACRAGTTTKYSFGDDDLLLNKYASLSTQSVGSKLANAWNLYDMHGNVAEYCKDYFDFNRPRGINPVGPVQGKYRVFRGAHDARQTVIESGTRGYCYLQTGYPYGFRVCLPQSGDQPGIGTDVADMAPKGDGTNSPPAAPSTAPPPANAPFDAAKAREYQEAWAKHLGVPVELTNSIRMKFTLIPPGEFMMGIKEESNAQAGASQFPLHHVTLTKTFYLGIYEVTQDQYLEVVRSNPSFFKGAQNPVDQVNFNNAVEFCEMLSELPAEKAAGRRYRLPTEAEWEFACRGGTDTRYFFGESEESIGDFAWYNENCDGTTHPVGEKGRNAFGLYDVYGNVWEWCSDRWGRWPEESVVDPVKADDSRGVSRGGSVRQPGEHLRSGDRFRRYLTAAAKYDGFRVVIEVNVAAFDESPPQNADVGATAPKPIAKAENALPSRDELAAAEAEVDAVFAEEERAAKKQRVNSKIPIEERLAPFKALAVKAHNLQKNERNLAKRFALCESSIRWAVDSWDTPLVDEYITGFELNFAVDGLQYRRDAVFAWYDQIEEYLRGKEISQGRAKLLQEVVLPLADRAEGENRLAIAYEFLELGTRLSDGKQRIALRKRLAEMKPLAERQQAMQKLAAEFLLAPNPDDALTLGKYWCFEKDNWEKGLPLLAAGSNSDIQAVAKLELSEPKTAQEKVALADAWWALKSTTEEAEQNAVGQRAAMWYHEASDDLTGLEKARVEKRLQEVDPLPQQSLLFYLPFDNSLLNLGQSIRQVEVKGDVQFVTDRFGRPGRAIQFGPGSCVEILNDESLFPFKTGEPLTYSMWVRSPATRAQIVASKYAQYGGGIGNNHFYLAVGSTNIAAWGTGQTRGPGKSGFGIDIEDKPGWCSQWSHFVVAFNPTESKGSVYCNGKLLHEGKMVFNEKESSPIPLRFGRLPYDSQGKEITQMDDVRIFDRELSVAEVSALYRSEK